MRYSREHKLETHARIVKKASVRLREKGAHGIGVADLMKDAGLTHGGFYAHFDSREALVIEAFAYAMDRSTERWRKLAEQTPPDKRLAAIVESYLTPLHRDDPGHGCAVPTLGAEIARESPKTRKAFAAKLEQMIDMLAAQIPEMPRKAARKQAMATMATMMGTLVLARIAGNGEFSDEILAAGREAVLDRGTLPKPAAKKSAAKKAASVRAALTRPRGCSHSTLVVGEAENAGHVRIFANALRVETLSKRCKDCKMPPKSALAKVWEERMRTIGHFIGGREVKGTSGRFADVFEPMTGDVQAQVALASKAEVRAAVENANGGAAGMGRHQSAAPRSRHDEVPGTGRA